MPNGRYKGPCEVRVLAPGVSGEQLSPRKRNTWLSAIPSRTDWLKNRGGWYATTTGGCWLWQKAKSSAGYPVMKVDGRCQQAAWVVYAAFKGAVPPGPIHLVHRCGQPACINPDHLQPLMQKSSLRR